MGMRNVCALRACMCRDKVITAKLDLSIYVWPCIDILVKFEFSLSHI